MKPHCPIEFPRPTLCAAALLAGLFVPVTPRAEAQPNVSNLTLIDTQNPDVEALAAIAGDASTFSQLRERNKRGVFISAGPVTKATTAGAMHHFHVLPRTDAAGLPGWTTADAQDTMPAFQPLFFWNDKRYQPLPQLTWYYDNPQKIGSWYFADSQWSSWASSLNNPSAAGQRQTDLYKRLELPSLTSIPLGPASTWQNNYRQLDTSARKLVIVIHGWQPNAPADPYQHGALAVLLKNLHDSMHTTSATGLGWDLFAYNWATDAATGPKTGSRHIDGGLGNGIENGVQAAEIGFLHGLAFGNTLRGLFAQDLEQIHFIVHSAGTWVARGASHYLHATASGNPPVQQITLLDPFNPEIGIRDWNSSTFHAVIPGLFPTPEVSTPLTESLVSNWHGGINAARLENIFAHLPIAPGTSHDRYWGPSQTGMIGGNVPYVNLKVGEYTDLKLQNIYAEIIDDGKKWNGHDGPIYFYAHTVNPSDSNAKASNFYWVFGHYLPNLYGVRERSHGSKYASIAGWDHSLFAADLSNAESQTPAGQRKQATYGTQYAAAAPAFMPPAPDSPIAYSPPPASEWSRVLVDVNEFGWVRIMLIPSGGGAAVVAGPARMSSNGSFSMELDDSRVLSGQFDLGLATPTLELWLDGTPVGLSFGKVTGSSPYQGMGAVLDENTGTLTMTMILADGSAAVAAIGTDVAGEPWQASAAGTVDGAGNLSVSAADGFSVSGKTEVGGGLVAEQTMVQPPADAFFTRLDPASQVVSAGAQSYQLRVESNGSWTATSNQTWASVSPPSGSGAATLTVTVAANGSLTQDRTAEIRAGGATHELLQRMAVPARPVLSAATSVNNSGFTVAWTGVAGATGYRIDVATNSGFTSFASGHNNLSLGNVTSHRVTGLRPSTTYFVRVRSANGGGASPSSVAISVTTKAKAPPAPNIVTPDRITGSGFRARWKAANSATSYRLDVATDRKFKKFVKGYRNKTVGKRKAFAVTGLKPGVKYFYRVRAINSGGKSPNSKVRPATTLKTTKKSAWIQRTFSGLETAAFRFSPFARPRPVALLRRISPPGMLAYVLATSPEPPRGEKPGPAARQEGDS